MLFAATLSAAAGCSGDDGLPYGPVSGTVTVGGAPAADVFVTFSPESDSLEPGPGSSAFTDAEGRYSLAITSGTPRNGAIVGPHDVRIYGSESLDGWSFWQPSVGENGGEGPPRRTPPAVEIPREGQPLRFTVEPGGTDEADFAF